MSQEELTLLAVELMKLGVSQRGIQELLSGYPPERVKKQLAFLPFRKAKRPEAFIIDAVRSDYSPPKEFFYAPSQTQPAKVADQLDESAELPDPNPPTDPDGHRAPDRLDPAAPDGRLEQARFDRDLAVPEADGADW
ncbi:MAG: hypothetical protein JSS66_08460 [Armatimonadetes bacterium]|nr:hypothetical protein [Armatimonadota bacterium]